MGIFHLVFTALHLISMFIDPCFFCVLVIDDHMKCIDLVISSAVALAVLRSVFDGFQLVYLVYLFYSQKNYDHDPHSRCYHLKMWAEKYIPSVIGMLSILPLPQVVLFIVVRQMRDSKFLIGMSLMVYLVLAQFPLRFICLYLLFSKARNSSGLLQLPSGLDNAIFYFFIYLLVGLIFGALWYFLALVRLSECWKEACIQAGCRHDSFHCNSNFGDRSRFQIDALCSTKTSNPTITITDYGMFEDALLSGIVQVKKLLPKLLYSFQWGTRSLSFAQDYQTSTSSWENIFSSVITVSGAVLISFLLWNVTQFLQHNRILERNIRLHMQEIERWGLFQKLSEDLKKEIRKYYRSVYQGAEGFNINRFFNDLPWDLSWAMKRQLCLPLLKKERVFAKMDEQILNGMWEHFKLLQYTEGRVLVQEGNPINKLQVIVGGDIQSSTTNCVRSVHGIELVKIVLGLMPHGSSLETVKALTNVEVFSIDANDLKHFLNQYRLPNGQLPSSFGFGRNWAAKVMQAAWVRRRKRKFPRPLRAVNALLI